MNDYAADTKLALAEVRPDLAELVLLNGYSARRLTLEEFSVVYKAICLARSNAGRSLACEECAWQAYVTQALHPNGDLVNLCPHGEDAA